MRRYQAVCDTHGPLGPPHPTRSDADRDRRQHHCQRSEDPTGLLRIAHLATAEALRRFPTMDRDDVLSDALLGVAQAHAAWNPDRGVPLGAYALRRARGAILDGIRDRGPVSRHEWAKGLRREDLPAHRQEHFSIQHLQDQGLAEIPIPDQRAASALETVEHRLELRSLLQVLNGQQRQVIVAYYWEGQRMHEIATVMGVTESRVCQIRKAALTRMHAETARVAA